MENDMKRDDLIRRSDALRILNQKNAAWDGYTDVLIIPAVDAVKVKHGRWLPVDEKNDAFDCSECDAMVVKKHNYCPNCGARMDGRREDGDGDGRS